jgi:dTDP-glucose 4,6-dehydratase
MRYLVTGGAGFIGSHLVEHLLLKNNEVTVIDNLSTGRIENINHIKGKINLVIGDICEQNLLKDVVKDIDVIFHLAAIPSVQRSIENPTETNRVNVIGTLNLLSIAAKSGIKRFIYASSSSVYGELPSLPKKEEGPFNPLSPYAVSKLSGEYYCRQFTKTSGIKVACVRLFNVFGPRQNPTSQYAAVIPRFITRLLNNQSPEVFGDGNQTRDFTYIENVVEGFSILADYDKLRCETVNIATGVETSVNKLIEMLLDIIQTKTKVVYMPPRDGDIKRSYADITKAQSIGFTPRVSIEEGLKRTVQYFKKSQYF